MIRIPEQCSLAGMNIKDNSENTHGNDKNEDDIKTLMYHSNEHQI